MTEILVRTVRAGEEPAQSAATKLFADASLEILAAGDPVDLDVYKAGNKLCVLCGRVATPVSAQSMLDRHDQHGPAAVARTDGHFVAVFHDRSTGATSVIHDMAGLRHAYYWVSASEFALSTDLHWLLESSAQAGALRPAISPRGLALYLTFQYVPAPRTVIEDVWQLPPASRLAFRRGSEPDLERLVEFPDSELRWTDTSSIEEQSERIGDILTASLTAQLAGEDKIGAMLSGGMDTSSAVALMVERVGVRPTTFTASFADSRYDEQHFAKIVADHYGLEQERVRIDVGMLDTLPAIVRAFDEPNADQAIFAQYFVCGRARDHGCRRVVTGEGGDEVLGYPQYHDAEVLGRPLLEGEALDYRDLPTDPAQLARSYVEKTFLAQKDTRDQIYGRLGIDPAEPYAGLERTYRAYSRHDPFERLLFGQWRTWLRSGVYMKDTRLLKHFGVVPVLPFMSTELMRYIAELPLDRKLQGMDEKQFLRILLAQRLPREILDREKHKFFLPWPRWSREDARDRLYDTLLSSRGPAVEFLGEKLVRSILDENSCGAANHSRLLWGLLFLQLWYDERIAHLGSRAPAGRSHAVR